MPDRYRLTLLAALACFALACSSDGRARVAELTPATPAAVEPPPAPAPPVDPVQALINLADQRFDQGRQELTLGHLARAKAAFNAALEVLLESPQGVRADARLSEHFDRLTDRIAALELTALATGDGFTEQVAEPASIDQLLAISLFDAAPPAPATVEHVEKDLAVTTHDIPIPLNERVLRYVELFQGRLREFLHEGLQNGTQYLPMIQSVFRAEGLPLDLAYVPLIESAFKPTALSRARAKGVWQFMRATAVEQGLRHDWYVDERSDPEKATVAAAKYLKQLYTTFGDWHLALASYNGGPGRVQRAMTRSGRKDFWSLSATTRFLPRETREYVPMILAAAIIARNPAQYGFAVTPLEPAAVETLPVPAAVDLRRIAEFGGISADDLHRFNPELRRWTTPIRGEYALKVPAGTAERIRERLAAANPAELNALQWHTVRRGETLTTIARKLRVSRTDLAEANYLRTTSRVNVGQKLLIPRMPSAAVLARAGAGTPAERAAEPAASPAVAEETTRIVHRVRSGDTLYSIARKYQTTVEQLKALNGLRSSTLKIGARLIVETRMAVAANQQQ